MNYILAGDGKTPIGVNDPTEWARWFEKADRHVAKTEVGLLRVSTVFLGIDHRFAKGGPPILWETMIFGQEDGEEREYMWRYASYEEALLGHHEAVKRAKKLSQAMLPN